MTFFEAILLGIIQGLTEFLPVSSSGHLEILNRLLGISGENNLPFTIAVHGGTVLSTIVVFWKQIVELIRGLFKFEMNWQTQFILKICVSFIPIVIVGLTLKKEVESLFGGNLLIVGIMLIVTGLLLLFSTRAKTKGRELGYRHAFWIGVAQAIAVLPGLSRSGSTISAGLLMGVKRSEVASFSFLMVLVPIIGINVLELAGGNLSASGPVDLQPVFAGFIAAFITGTLACKMMINLVKKGNLVWFSVYCFIVGTATLLFLG